MLNRTNSSNRQRLGASGQLAPPTIMQIAPFLARLRAATLLFAFALLAVTVPAQKSRSDNTIILNDTSVSNLRIQTVIAEPRTFESIVFAIGRIEEIPANHSVLSSRIAGRIVKIHAFEGDTVKQGDILAEVESRQPGNPPPTINLKAPLDGLVTASHVRLGQPVQPDGELLDISDRTNLWAVAKIPEQDASLINIGFKARIHIPAMGDETIDATLFRFGVAADREAGTIEGIFMIPNPDGRLRPGMRSEFSIIVATRDNVLSVPRAAIQGDPTDRVIFAKDFDLKNAFIRLPVILGEQNDEYIEILRGLFPGDEIVTQGSYSLGFAGGDSGISLKEALDAAHGHEHNEDGSELTPEQKASKAKPADAIGNTNRSTLNLAINAYAAIATILLIIFAQLYWKKSNGNKTGDDHA